MTAKEKVLKLCPDAKATELPTWIRISSPTRGLLGVCCIKRENWAWVDALSVIKQRQCRGEW